MTIGYVARRIGVFLLIIIVAVTINFIMPRLRSTNPIEQRLHQKLAAVRAFARVNSIDRDIVRAEFPIDEEVTSSA